MASPSSLLFPHPQVIGEDATAWNEHSNSSGKLRAPLRFSVIGGDKTLLTGVPVPNARFEAIVAALAAAYTSFRAQADAVPSSANQTDPPGGKATNPEHAPDGSEADDLVLAATVSQLPLAHSSPFPRLVGEGALKSRRLQLLASIRSSSSSLLTGAPASAPETAPGRSPWGILCSALQPAPRPQPMPRPTAPAAAAAAPAVVQQDPKSMWQMHCWSAGHWRLMMHIYPGPRSKRCYARWEGRALGSISS